MAAEDVKDVLEVDAKLDALDDPSSSEVWRATKGHTNRAIAAAAARRALEGGGGPGGPVALDDLTDVDTAGGSEGDVLTQQGDGSFALEPPVGGSQSSLDVTLTDVGVNGPAVAAEFTIPAGWLEDGQFLNFSMLADWTSGPYTTLELKVNDGDPLMLAERVYADDSPQAAPVGFQAVRTEDKLIFRSGPPRVPGVWTADGGADGDGWIRDNITAEEIDWSQDVTVQLLVTLDSASVDNYLHPTSALAVLDAQQGIIGAVAAALARYGPSDSLSIGNLTSSAVIDASIINVDEVNVFNGDPLVPANHVFNLAATFMNVHVIQLVKLLTDSGDDATRIFQVGGKLSLSETVFWINEGGHVVNNGVVSAPDDADINPGECFSWFDPTNGSPKVKYRARQANGTLVSGEVALA